MARVQDRKPRNRKPVSASTAVQRVVVLIAQLRIGNASALKAELSEALASGGEVVLDATAVQSADSAGLQLLYAFVRDSKSRGMAVSWRDSEQTLRREAGLLDLDKALGLPGAHRATGDRHAEP